MDVSIITLWLLDNSEQLADEKSQEISFAITLHICYIIQIPIIIMRIYFYYVFW